MGYRNYTRADYTDLAKQHNIMALVGNGFDIQVMRDFDQPHDTRYETFYHYLRFSNFDLENSILEEMRNTRDRGAENWSDVESALEALLKSGRVSVSQLLRDLSAVQSSFSGFLNQVVPPDLLTQIGRRASDRQLTITSLEKFVFDIEDVTQYDEFTFPLAVDHYDLLNFFFVNFNYTMLLDDYIYLDQAQFDPHRHHHADRNFSFYPNPRRHNFKPTFSDTIYSCYLNTEIVHPHGVQGVPRSILFGIDTPTSFSRGTGETRKLMKAFWSQCDKKYEHLFDDTRLFIIFGCSLGATDRWWWSRIARALLNPDSDSELLIYWWSADRNVVSEQHVREHFARAANALSSDLELLFRKISVVVYESGNHRKWLHTGAAERD